MDEVQKPFKEAWNLNRKYKTKDIDDEQEDGTHGNTQKQQQQQTLNNRSLSQRSLC